MSLLIALVVTGLVAAIPIVLVVRCTNRHEPFGNRELGLFLNGLRAPMKRPRDRDDTQDD